MMAKRKTELPAAAFKKIIKKAGGQRVSISAANALCEIASDTALDIASRAVKLSTHAGRKTVTAQDIKLAVKAL
jgi:histone H3/H4